MLTVMCCAASAEKDREWVTKGKELLDTACEKGHTIAAATVTFWEAESTRIWLKKWYIRLLAAAALALGLATAVVNMYAVPSINSRLLPQASAMTSRVFQRNVRFHSHHA